VMRGTWQTTSGGGGLILAVIAAVVLIGSGAVSAAAGALASLLVTVLIVVASLITLAVLGAVAGLVYRARQDPPGRPIGARTVSQLPPVSRSGLEGSYKSAIGAGREVHLHLNVTPDQLAAILRNHTEEDS
jgi:hypothetical protein